MIDPTLLAGLENNGYHTLIERDGQIVGLHDYVTTRGIVVGLDDVGYERRYCYQERIEASLALAAWGDTDHPPGNWIKLKGTFKGEVVDMLNPNWSKT